MNLYNLVPTNSIEIQLNHWTIIWVHPNVSNTNSGYKKKWKCECLGQRASAWLVSQWVVIVGIFSPFVDWLSQINKILTPLRSRVGYFGWLTSTGFTNLIKQKIKSIKHKWRLCEGCVWVNIKLNSSFSDRILACKGVGSGFVVLVEFTQWETLNNQTFIIPHHLWLYFRLRFYEHYHWQHQCLNGY